MSKAIIPLRQIAQGILHLRGQKVILDYDLARLYDIETRALKQAVRRNRERFPSDFMFELSISEIEGVVSQSVIPSRRHVGKHDEEIAAIIDAIRQLMAPPEKPRREIGFHVREKSPRYRTGNHR
jgi:hypothetical protein